MRVALLVAALVLGGWLLSMKKTQLVLARTMYGEARGEGDAGMVAVGNVVINRARSNAWYAGGSIAGAALMPWQFSAWNEDDPNRAKIEALEPGQGDAAFDRAYVLAGQLLRGEIADNTGGATHYHASSVNPPWAADGIVTAQIGDHTFYSGVA